MAQLKKYFKSKKDAQAAAAERNRSHYTSIYHVYKCTKGMRHVGMYAVCDDLEWLNTY